MNWAIAWNIDSFKTVRRMKNLSNIVDNVDQCINTAPNFKLTIHNYHENKTKSGNVIRVDTNYAEESFEVKKIVDRSPEKENFDKLKDIAIMRLKMDEIITMHPKVCE